MLASIKLWCHAARPKTLFIGAAPIAIGTVLAASESLFSVKIFLWTLFGALMMQIGTNYCNDYFDFLKGADTSHRKGPRKILQQGLVSPKAMLIAFLFCFACAGLSTYVLAARGGLLLVFVGITCIAFSILYTAPPFPLAYLGLGDLFVLVFYGPIATLFCYYLQALHFSLVAFVASLAPGLLGVLVLTINNLRDYEEDKKVHKKTLVVRLGLAYGKAQALIVLALALMVPPSLTLLTRSHPYLPLSSLILLVVAFPSCKKLMSLQSTETRSLFTECARMVPLYTLLFCMMWFV